MESELRELSRALTVAAPDRLSAAIMARLPQPGRRRRRQLIALACASAVIAATVLVAVVRQPTAGEPTGRMEASGLSIPGIHLLPTQQVIDLDTARSLTEVRIPQQWGTPNYVAANYPRDPQRDDSPRVISFFYLSRKNKNARESDGLVAGFDQTGPGTRAQLPAMVKGEPVSVNGSPGVWAAEPVALGAVEDVRAFWAPAQLAANTLIWNSDRGGFRLLGDFTKEQAVAIAESVK